MVADDGDRFVLYLAPGTEACRWVAIPTAAISSVDVRRASAPARLAVTSILSLTQRGASHSLWHFWDEQWNFVCWYVQLHTPVVEANGGFELTDQALDVLVEPDGSWRWKDEDDFAEAQALGIFTPEEAAAVRAEGERVVEAKPWPTGWEGWTADPVWETSALPDGWDVVRDR